MHRYGIVDTAGNHLLGVPDSCRNKATAKDIIKDLNNIEGDSRTPFKLWKAHSESKHARAVVYNLF